MAAIYVRYADGTTDTFGTDGGETDALAEELAADPDVDEVIVDYDRRNQ